MEKSRYDELKRMLNDRRRELMNEVRGRIRDVRTENAPPFFDIGPGERSEADEEEEDIQDDIEFVLIQMKTETLNKLNEALRLLETGKYGNCFTCKTEIHVAWLRALPFAVCCKDCEGAHEDAERRESAASRQGSIFRK